MGKHKASSKKVTQSVAAIAAQVTACERRQDNVIAFYGDKAGKRFREFSNFYSDAHPFEFTLPTFAQQTSLPFSVQCEFSEKAIMLTKAALFGDTEIFRQIVKAGDPKSCKSLGRRVRNFDEATWGKHLEDVAFEVVRQKFEGNSELRKVLLSTGNKIIAEAAPNDCIWGIGLGPGDDRALDPAQWRGKNVLGHALMRVRGYLRGDTDAAVATVVPAHTCTDSGTEADGPSLLAVTQTTDVPGVSAVLPSSHLSLELDAEEDFLRPVSDLAAVRACYERYGVVGVTGVLSSQECCALINNGLEPYLPTGCCMNDPDTYSLADGALNRYGVIGKAALFNPAILSARLHPNVAASYAAVYGRDDVVACHDRAAWMRPVAMNPSWDTPFSWPGLHVDVNLKSYFADCTRSQVDEYLCGCDYGNGNFVAENNAKHVSQGRSVQGVLNLLDNEEEDGGFQCVPGMFGPILQRWVKDHSGSLQNSEVNGRYDFKSFGPDAKLGNQAVRVPCPAGTLILFDGTLPHGTRPNASTRSRSILFVRYITPDLLPSEAWRNRNAALYRVSQEVGFVPDARQARHLYGPET